MTLLAVALLACVRSVAAQDLPNVDQAQLAPQFWLSRTPKPDAVLLTSEEINRINTRIYKNGRRVHPSYEHHQVPGERVTKYLDEDLRALYHWKKYDRQNRRMRDPYFHNLMKEKLALEAIPKVISVRYGLTVAETPVRVMPTDTPVQRRPDEPDFDILQNSMLDVGSPVAGYHVSRDGQWEYIQSSICRGWVKRADIGVAKSKDEIKDFMRGEDFLVVTGKAVTVYEDRGLTKRFETLGMAGRIPLVRRESRRYVVKIPRRDPRGRLVVGLGYLPLDAEVHEGFLDFTARNVAMQAFKWLGEPYGWGDVNRQVDCSRFVMNIFGTFGFELPRTSHLQVESVGRSELSASLAKKQEQLDALPAFRTLLEFPGHIGLYLGRVGGRHYVIHSLGSYYVRENGSDVERKVKRVVVSDLSLGEGGKRGSLFESAKAAGVIR